MNADGTNLLKLTTPVSSADDESPNWSPDGRRIVFSSTRDFHNDNVWIVNADGGGVTRVTTNDSRGIYPVWSPDGSRIAFTSDRSQDAYSIYTIAPDGTGVSRVTSGGRFDLDPDWQPVPGPRRGDYRNAAEFCRAERSFLGDEAFAQEYGSNGSGANAYGRCVSQA
jgi:TolB protein